MLVCVDLALGVWSNSVVERTTCCRAVKPSAAREWPKSLPPGVTTDQSVKVQLAGFCSLSLTLDVLSSLRP